MVRFAAYDSESEEEEDVSFVEAPKLHRPPPAGRRAAEKDQESAGESEEEEDSAEESESEASDASSRMDEDELVSSPPARTTAAQKGKQRAAPAPVRAAMRGRRSSASSGRTSTSASSSGSPPPAPPRDARVVARTDTTIIPWAQQVGVDAQKMHVMQTSLFRMPEEARVLRENEAGPANGRKTLHLRPQGSLIRKHSRDSEGEGLRTGERASFAHDIGPIPLRPSRKYARVDSAASAVLGNEDAVVDAGLALGRSFRVGWGPGGTLVHLGRLCSPSSTIDTTANSSIITKTAVPLFSQDLVQSERFSKLLQHQLSHSPIAPDADGVPFADPSRALDFASFASLFSPTDRSFEASLFRLGHALFDPIDLRLSPSATPDVVQRVATLRRRLALSKWLEDAVAPTVEAELRANPLADAAAVTFARLSGHQVERACTAAADGAYAHLATLIAQADGDADFRADLAEQLALWRAQRADVHIAPIVRRIYALLAGIVGVLEGSEGTGLERCADIDVAHGLDWKRAFGLRLWYGTPMDTSIADVLAEHEHALADSGPGRPAPPVPWYAEHASEAQAVSPAVNSPDALYALIRMHAEPEGTLSDALASLSFGPGAADCSLPWHLYVLFSRCMRVRDLADRGRGARLLNGVDEAQEDEDKGHVEGHSPSADLLASAYAGQLEQLGMIQEAVFVLLHIEGSRGREKAIKDLLARSAVKLDDWTIRGIIGSLKIPMVWVDEAKAIYALDNDDSYTAYEHYLSAGLYNAAHDLAVLDLAPDAVIRQDLPLLQSIFDRFSGHPIDGWHVRGKVFLDYVHAMVRLPELRAHLIEVDAVPDAAEASELDDLCRTVPKLVGILPDVLRDRADPRHNAALAEMISGLMLRLDQVRPLAMSQAQVTPTLVDEATRLRHIHSTAYERFLRTIAVA